MKHILSTFCVTLLATGCTHTVEQKETVSKSQQAQLDVTNIFGRRPASIEGDAPQKLKSLSQSIAQDREDIEQTLAARSYILTREINFEAKGSLHGEVDGNIRMKGSPLNLKTALIGSLLGGAGGLLGEAAATAMPSMLTSALGIEQLMIAGGLMGGVAGALLPTEDKMTGKISGKLDGNYEAAGWDNHYQAKHFVVTVLDPEISQYIDRYVGSNQKSSCLDKAVQLQKLLLESGRYLTPKEATSLVQKLDRIRKSLADMKMLSSDFSLDTSLLTNVRAWIAEQDEWQKKRLSIVSIGRHDVELVLRTLYEVTYSIQFRDQDRNEETVAITTSFPSSKIDFAALLNSWLAKQAANSSRGATIDGLPLNFYYADDLGIYKNQGLFNKTKEYLSIPAPRFVKTAFFKSKSQTCLNQPDSEAFLNASSKSEETFFGYVDSYRILRTLNAQKMKITNTN